MYLINTSAFVQWGYSGGQVDHRTKILEFCDDEVTEYAILSHRWIDSTEIGYEDMVDFAKMDRHRQYEIRCRPGYKKILNACKKAETDGYQWMWADTCCIDKRSSAELSEAINSMYRWYGNARVCYAYLHDVDGSSFPTEKDDKKYHKSNGWPEWFSRGWTLQEMIAPRDVQFFNKNWQPIGDKKGLARNLGQITGVPRHILADGLERYRPCVAQIMSWAAGRTTTRVEDRAYSLMGLLEVNMPMLYGEGKKAFHRLQLEIIRSSNDQSIFAWGFMSSSMRIGSVLADDPSFFEDCAGIELQSYDEFMKGFPEQSSISADNFGVFPITNRGIQIWMLLRPYRNSDSVFKAYLPCLNSRGSSVSIDLVLYKTNYYRCPSNWSGALEDSSAKFLQVYLRYRDTPHHTVTFGIDDSGLIENGFTRSHVDPKDLTGNTFTLTEHVNPFCITYSEEQENSHFKVVFGQWLGLGWVHLACIDEEASIHQGLTWTVSMANTPSLGLWIRHFRLPESTWIVRTYYIVWERSKVRLRMEVFQSSHFQNGLDEWNAYDVEKIGDPSQDPRGLMLSGPPCKRETRSLWMDGAYVEFSLASEGIRLGDYGSFSDSGHFCVQGNLFSDLKPRISEADITPRQTTAFDFDIITTSSDISSLPNNPTFNSFLATPTPQLINSYLVTRVGRRYPDLGRDFDIVRDLCTIRKPLFWHPDLIRCINNGPSGSL